MIIAEKNIFNFQVPGDGEGGGTSTDNTIVEGESGQEYENVPADTTIDDGGADVLIPA